MTGFTHTRRACAFAALSILASVVGRAAAQVTPVGVAGPRAVPVVWLIGQSNAEGATAGFWLANPMAPGNRWPHLAFQPRVNIFWPGASLNRPGAVPAWETYRVGSFLHDNGSFYIVEGTFGPEAALGDAGRARFGEVFVFKFPQVAALDPRATPTWSKRPGQFGVYDALMFEWRRAVNLLRARSLVPELRGIVLVHGEGDCFAPGYADRSTFARSYATNLRAFVADLRADLTGPRRSPIPFAVSQLHDRHVPRADWQQPENLIRAAQAQIAREDPRVGLTTTDALGLIDEGNRVHFDAPSTIRHGFALFATLATMLR